MDYQEEKKQEGVEEEVSAITSSSSPKELQSILLNGGSLKANQVALVVNQGVEDDDEELNNADLAIVRDILGRSLSNYDSSVMSMEESKDMMNSAPARRGVSFSGIDSPASSKADDEKTIGELIAKIQSLQIKVDKTNIDLSAEKSIRKKKERNLVKLAKELTKRTDELAAKNKQIVKLVETCRVFEDKAAEKTKELEERTEAIERIGRERHKEITEAQQKYRSTCRDHDTRINDMNKIHAMEMEGLRREVLSSKLEADRLRAKLARAEMTKDPSQAEKIVERTMRESITPSTESSGVAIKIFISLLLISGLAVGAVFKMKLTTLDAWCAPALPGTLLSENVALEAPWWAPEAYKAKAFAVCGDRPRTRVVLTQGKFTATKLNGKDDNVMNKRGVAGVEIHPDRVMLLDNKGRAQRFDPPWKL